MFKVYKITFYLHLIASSQGGCVIYIDTHDLHAVGYPSGRHAGLPPRSQGADPGLHMLNHLISIDSFIMVINSFGRASNLEVSNRQKKNCNGYGKKLFKADFSAFSFCGAPKYTVFLTFLGPFCCHVLYKDPLPGI